MQEERVVISAGTIARFAGLFYLAYIVIFASATTFLSPSITWTDAAATVQTIQTSQGLFRFAGMLVWIADLFFLLAAWALYVLFKPVNRSVALLFLLLNMVGVCIESSFTLVHSGALVLVNGSPFLGAFQPSQLQSLALLLLQISSSTGKVTTLFYGAWLFPLGYLVVKSRMVPKVFGILLLLDGSALMICFFQLNLFPDYEKWMYPLYPVMLIAELGFALWLAIKGVREAN
jgi:Domain of unknown function (DUF4386)